ncbi:MAG: glutamate--tRNA ligase, partial [Bdellovibrionota bacterium]
RKHAEDLLASGAAYRCFCSKEAIDEIRKQAEEEESAPIAAYDGRCSKLSQAEISAKLAAQAPHVIRQRIDHTGSTRYQDVVYGEITISNDQLDDQVLMKADGFPTYNFANVVDDHLMQITHVLRGTEYLSSTPKYILLYEAFGWQPPICVHLPLILGPSGKKLSKRDGSVSLSDFIDQGYLPAAIINYIALLGWSPGDDSEFFTLSELCERFDISRINKAAAIFDEVKLKHINSLHIKALPPEAFHALAAKRYSQSMAARFDTHKVSHLIQNRVEKLTDISPLVAFLETMPFPYDRALFEHKKMKTSPETARSVLEEIKPLLEGLGAWNVGALTECLNSYTTTKALKNGQVLWPLRVALTGLPTSPGGAIEVADLLGKTETMQRLNLSLGLLK